MNDESQTPGGEKNTARPAANCMCGGTGPSISRFMQMMAPPEGASKHFRQARVEMLKGIRELLDQRIDALQKDPEQKGTKVSVE